MGVAKIQWTTNDQLPADELDCAYSHYGITTFINSAVTTTSATFEDMNSIKFPLRYMFPGSSVGRLEVYISATTYATVAPTECEIGVQIDGIDYTVAHIRHDVANADKTIWGFASIQPSLSGSYTASIRWRRTSGTGVVTVLPPGQVCCTVAERVNN